MMNEILQHVESKGVKKDEQIKEDLKVKSNDKKRDKKKKWKQHSKIQIQKIDEFFKYAPPRNVSPE